MTGVFVALSCAGAVLFFSTYLKLTRLRGEIRLANDIIGSIETDRDHAAKGTVTEAADILWKLHFPNIHWIGEPVPFHDSVARLVEGRRHRAIGDVISYLRSKTADDLGRDPEAWILKYGSDLSKDQLNAMKSKVTGEMTGNRSNKKACSAAEPAERAQPATARLEQDVGSNGVPLRSTPSLHFMLAHIASRATYTQNS